MAQNSTTQIMTKLRKLKNCDKTLNCNKTQTVTKLKNLNGDKTQTQIETKQES